MLRIKKSTLQLELPKRKLFTSGNSRYAITFPSRIMRAFGWQENEPVKLIITPEEIRIVRIGNDKQNKR